MGKIELVKAVCYDVVHVTWPPVCSTRLLVVGSFIASPPYLWGAYYHYKYFRRCLFPLHLCSSFIFIHRSIIGVCKFWALLLLVLNTINFKRRKTYYWEWETAKETYTYVKKISECEEDHAVFCKWRRSKMSEYMEISLVGQSLIFNISGFTDS